VPRQADVAVEDFLGGDYTGARDPGEAP